MPLFVYYWADLQSVHGLCCNGNIRNAWQSPAVIRQAHRTPHALRRPAKIPLTRDKIDAPAAFAIPFCPYCGGVLTQTRNVSEYMLVLTVCLVYLLYVHYVIHRVKNLKCRNSQESMVKCPVVKFEFQQSLKSC